MMKWKVKRRQDGTKYIVQKPYISSSKKSNNPQLTSDDELVAGELKLRKHTERSKVRRHRQKLRSSESPTTVKEPNNE